VVPYAQATVDSVRHFTRRLSSHPNFVPLVIIVLAILAVNLPTLVDLVTRNPLQIFAGLQVGAPQQAVPGGSIIDPNAGFVTAAVGHLVAMDWLHGHIPWWNPYEGFGSPLAGEMQSAAFFPPVLLLQGALGFVVFHVLLEVVAGYATYLLLRRLNLGRAASTAGGVAFGLCGTLAWFEHATANPVAFLPLALLGVERARAAALEYRRPGWRLLAVALALSVVAGFPEVAYLDGLMVGVWAVVRLSSIPGRRQAMLARLSLGVVVGVLLSAPALVAFIDYLPDADVGSHSGAFANVFLPIQSLAQTILPYGFGSISGLQAGGNSQLLIDMWGNTGGYLDATLVVCALIGLLGARFRGLRIALAVWVFLAMSKTFGVTSVSHLLNHLPAFHSIAFYRYSQTSWEFAVVVLAALGIDDMARRRTRPTVIVAAGVLTLGAIVWAASEAWPVVTAATGYSHRRDFTVASVVLGTASVIVVAGGGLFLCAGYRRAAERDTRRRAGLLLVAGAIVVEASVLFAVPLLSAPRPAKTDSALVLYLQRHLGLARFATLGPIQPNFGSMFDLAEINVNDLPVPKSFASYVTKNLDSDADPLTFTGTVEATSNGPGPAAELASHLAAYEASGVRYVVASAASLTAVDSQWPAESSPPRLVYKDSVADVWRLPAVTPFFTTSGARCHVRSEGVATVEVTCAGPAVLHRLELPMPGWSARAGSSALPIRVAGPFQTVAVGAGTTTVHYSFTPRYGDTSLYAVLAGLVCIGGSFFLRRSRTPTSEPESGRQV
jgi:hypothetical protein